MSWIEILSLLTLAFWIALRLDRSRRWPVELRLPEGGDAGPAETVIAVVPARNEAGVLPETLPLLLAQKESTLRVVLVDDGSADGTAEVARRLAEAAGAAERLRVVAAGPPPDGWSGKVWALERGVVEADRWAAQTGAAGWLLLTDADIRHRPGSVRDLLARAAAYEVPRDLVSIMARLRADRFWERLLIPSFVLFFQLLYPFRKVADDSSTVAAAAGGCILVRRSVLRQAGGLAAIRGEIIDDLALARLVRDAGGRLWLGLDQGIESVRPYRGLAGVWRMVTRTAFVQLGRRVWLVALTVAGLVLLVASPPFLLAAGAIARLGPLGAAPLSPARAVLWSFLAWALEAIALRPAVRHHRLATSYAWSLPFAALAYAAMTVDSARNHLSGRGAGWKGRHYDGA